MSSLGQIVYRSKSANPALIGMGWSGFTEEIRRRNHHRGVTGVLMFDGEYFLQVLEGDTNAVQSLYETIQRDARHSGVVTIMKESIPFRRFDSWSSCIFEQGNRRTLEDMWAADPADVNAHIRSLASERVSTVVEAFTRGLWEDRKRHASEAEFSEIFSAVKELSDQERADFQKFGAEFAYQPIVDLRSSRVSGYEALIRGKNGQSPADLFRGMSGGTLHMFDLRSKAWAIAVSSKLQPYGNLSINLLPQSLFVLTDAAEALMESVRERGLVPEQITVEVTEEEVITSPDLFFRAIEKLRAFGFKISIDDFGAGYAGLSLLVDFQPDTLKIDRRIVQGIDANGPRQAIVRAIVDFCYCLGIGVVAEGVETPEEMKWLTAAGVDKIQGFLLAKPMVMGLPPVLWPRNGEKLP